MPLFARVLHPPSYGWVTDKNRPTKQAIQAEWLHNVLPTDRRRWITSFTWTWSLILFAFLPVYLIFFATWTGVCMGALYAFLVLPCWGTVYLHRYGTHRAFRFRNKLWAAVGKHIVIQLIPEEVYIISHHVHHAYADQDLDPYDPRGGWWYCFLADANHQRVAQDLTAQEHARVSGLLDHLAIRRLDYAGYQRWGSLTSPIHTVASFALNWIGWYSVLWMLGGHGLAMGIFAMSALWLLGIRQFNFRAHGRGVDMRVDGVDFCRDDLSVNQTLSAWLAGEWHNNHHLFPNSAKAGFQRGQLDLAWRWIQVYALLGIAVDVRDDTERFERLFLVPWLARQQQPAGEDHAGQGGEHEGDHAQGDQVTKGLDPPGRGG